MKNDLLELEIHEVKPEIHFAEIFFDGCWHPWHSSLQLLEIKHFYEDFEIVKNKLIEYYKAETADWRTAPIIRGGKAELTTNEGEFNLENCKIVDCDIDEDTITINLKLSYDGISYKCYKNEKKAS